VVLHCSATRPGSGVNAATIREWHISRGWQDIGYHFVILEDGAIERGRHLHLQGSHVQGHNADTIGVCYVGGLGTDGKPKDTMTAAQNGAFLGLLEALRRVYGPLTLHGHNEFANKACPSFVVSKKYRAVLG
jgi:N-acetylmuramoyl-L-alanine amidase